MAEVLVRRCRVRIVRRGGWSWGPDPERILRGVVAALPGVLARKLAGMWPEGADAEIATPIRLRIPIRLEELCTPKITGAPAASPHAPGLAPRIEALVEAALRARLMSAGVIAPPAQEVAAPEAPVVPSAAPIPAGPAAGVARLLMEWSAAGKLEFMLDYLPGEELERWHALLRASRPERGTPAGLEEVLTGLVGECIKTQSPAPPRGVLRARVRIATAIDVARRGRCAPDEPLLWRIIDERLPLEPPPARRQGGERLHAESSQRASAPAPRSGSGAQRTREARARRETARAPAPQPVGRAELHVRSALPFLLLGPLERCGYLDTVAACLESLELASDAYLFAAALAYKALPAPERGWRREQIAADASVFAGVHGGIPEPALVSFAASMEAHLAPLRAVLIESLRRGHTANAPLLLLAAGVDFVLFDPEALIPVDCARHLRNLFLTIQKFGAPLLIAPESASAVPLQELRDAALPYALSPAVREREHRAAEVWRELAELRPCAPLASERGLDGALTLAAASAMGTIAWQLWREREPPDPLLVLERFGDLEARVRFEEKTVRVRLPLGGRYLDLHRHGLLAPVRKLPWLGGRGVEFSGG